MQTITVDMTPGFRQPTIHYSQNDVGTTFAIDLRSRFGDTLPASPTVKIQATKPSGFGFSIEADSVVGSVATFTTVDTMTDEAGRFQAELEISEDSVVLYTANFYMEGEANPHPIGTTDGSQETIIPTLTLLVERVEAAAASVLDMTVNATTLAAGSQATYSYDEDTNTATFGIPQGEAGAGAAGVTASAYSSSSTYAVGDYVIHNSNLYRCTTAITTAEAFTAAHWTQVVLGDDVADLKSDLTNITSAEPIKFTPNGVIATNGGVGSTVTLTPTENSSFAYAIVNCSQGDKIILNGKGWTTGRLWAFIDSDNKIIEASAASITVSDLILIAPASSAKCVLNSWKTYLGNCFKDMPSYLTDRLMQSDIDGIEDQICAKYTNFEQGTINGSGVPVSSASVMRTADFIPLEKVKSISVNNTAYMYLRIYDAYQNYLGSVITMGYGDDYPNETVNYNSIKTSFPQAGNLKITLHGASAITPSNIANTGIEFIYYQNLKVKSVTVDINGSGDYTSILRALKSTEPTTKVYVKTGTYNVVNEYTDYYGASFWSDYAGFGGSTDNFLRGLYVSNGRVLEFESGAIVKFDYSGSNENVAKYFSVLATGFDSTIIGGYLDYGNGIAEYAIHDDNATQAGTNVYRGIIIDGVPSGRGGNHIGGGCGKRNTYILQDIIFLDTNMPDNYGDMYFHNNSGADAINRIFVKNCRGLRSCTFRWHGASTEKTYCIASGNSFKRIRCIQHEASDTNENMVLIAYNNITTE